MIETFVNPGTFLMLVGFTLIIVFMALTGRMPRKAEMSRLRRLEATVETLQEGHIRDQKRISQLERELSLARLEIDRLERLLQEYRGIDLNITLPPAKPLLLVMCHPKFGEDDVQAIRRTQIPFQRLKDATAKDFDRFLQEARQDGTTPWWVQISAHMGEAGIQFADGVQPVGWLSQRIRDIKVLMLAGCDNERVAAGLVGLAQHVLVIYEEVETVYAADFTYAFWSRIGRGFDPVDAYAQALTECPQISEFVWMRSAR